MDKLKKIKILSAVSIIGAILAITVAFAIITRSMVINGSGNVKPALWDIHFKDISSPTITGGASVITAPTVADKGAKIDNLEVRLTLPQDKVEYTVYIENSGDMNAKIDDIKYPALTNEESKIFKFSAKYEKDGSQMQVGDTLYKGQTKKVIITIEYLDISDKNLLPKEAKTIDIDFKIKYVQDNKEYASFDKDKASLVSRNANWVVFDYPIENGEYNMYLNISDFDSWTNYQKDFTCNVTPSGGYIVIRNNPTKVFVSTGKIRIRYSPSLSGKFGPYTNVDKILSNFEKYLVIEKAN